MKTKRKKSHMSSIKTKFCFDCLILREKKPSHVDSRTRSHLMVDENKIKTTLGLTNEIKNKKNSTKVVFFFNTL
jgi:hypothetical protein